MQYAQFLGHTLCKHPRHGQYQANFFIHRFHRLHLFSIDCGCCPHFPICTTLWAYPHGRICWNLFTHGVSYGLFQNFELVDVITLGLCIPKEILRLSLIHLQVMSVKAVGIALKLTFSEMNQFKYFETWVFVLVVTVCCVFQLNYLNKVNTYRAIIFILSYSWQGKPFLFFDHHYIQSPYRFSMLWDI